MDALDAVRSAETAVDEAVDAITQALHRHGIYLPSVRSDVLMINGSYLVNLGSAQVGTITALAKVLDSAVVAP